MTEKERVAKWGNIRVDARSGTLSGSMGLYFASAAGKKTLEDIGNLPDCRANSAASTNPPSDPNSTVKSK